MPLASIEGGYLCKVWEIKTLGLVKDAEARKLLEDVAKQVEPIMRKRKWKVPLLSEFCPRDSSLLGLNIDAGREIRIRLRKHRSDPRLFGYEETLGTMLHELTHIQCGPHNAAFYKLLDVLTKECEELMIEGITGTGQGFDARGQRLGGVAHNPAPSNLRQVALAAAQKRAQSNSIMPVGPRRLGGDSAIMKALSPLQAAAMAAERRLKDDFWCAAPFTAGDDGMLKARQREDSAATKPAGLNENSENAGAKVGTRDNAGGSAVPVSNVSRNRAGVGSLGVRPSTSRVNPTKESYDAAASKENRGLRENAQNSEVPINISVKKNARDAGLSDATAAVKRRTEVSERDQITAKEGRVPDFGGEGSQRSPILLDDPIVRSNEAEKSCSWQCHVCTLLNPTLALSCGVCGALRRQKQADITSPVFAVKIMMWMEHEKLTAPVYGRPVYSPNLPLYDKGKCAQ
ncbi:hypothetical protein AXG93_4332s1110 [Marchantia polymorpha subsp. ruderalis]|uniref:WLM domain-containing protein n=1 Tax=Marchantia polymorpha subsp. ruderalis TaxID=1480154 RepID=A0A176W2B5_MARPO|nr:hypothetical protein AXG93_4332s1110 [Marchantia polymorpha subsp. ruderalis]